MTEADHHAVVMGTIVSTPTPWTDPMRLSLVLCVGIAALFGAPMLAPAQESFSEIRRGKDVTIFETQSQWQGLKLTEFNGDYRLFIDGILQFSSMDEAR